MLHHLKRGDRVAVVTLRGTFCPITLGHVEALVKGQELLLENHGFSHVLGFFSVNRDAFVARKFERMGEEHLNKAQRQHLVRLAIEDFDWIGLEDSEGESISGLQRKWRHLTFVHYRMNGADDVLKYRKWRHAGPDERYLTMGRPGYTEKLAEATANVNQEYFIVGPECADVSSTAVRRAFREGTAVDGLLHPRVIDWCQEHSPWRPRG